MNKSKNLGFTLVELMIATTIFSVVMMLSTMTFLRINSYYIKGMSIARTQDTARNVVMDISNQLQLTAGGVSPSTGVTSSSMNTGDIGEVCVGNKRYTFRLNVPENGTGNALKSVEAASGCGAAIAGTEQFLLRKDTRVLVFKVDSIGGSQLYRVQITLLNAPDDGEGGSGTDLVEDFGDDGSRIGEWKCKTGVAGAEYCALTTISTTVTRRVI